MDETEILKYLKNTEDYESVRFVQSFQSRNMRKNINDRKKSQFTNYYNVY